MAFAERLGWLEAQSSVFVEILVSQALYAIAVFSVVAALSFVTRNRFPRLQYGLWSLVLLRLVLPTGLATSWSARTILERAAPSSAYVHSVFELSAQQATASPRDEVRLPWSTVTLLFWGLGATSVAALMVRKRRFCRRLIGRSNIVRGEVISAMAERWRSLLKIRRPVKLVTADEPLSPFTLGTLRPIIFLPSSFFARSDPALLEAAIAHEMAHVKRWDDLRLLLVNLVRSLYFFHPVVWISARRMEEERERICDDMVLARGALSPRDYGRSLLEALRLGWESSYTAASFGKDKRRISMRIQRILKGSVVKRGGRVTSLFAVFFLGSFLLPMARSSQSAVLRFEAQPSLAADMANPLPGGRVTSTFGERKNPFDGTLEHHTGIDIAAPRGAEIVAPAAGVVELAEKEYRSRPELGTVIVIDHGQGTKTFYAHLGSLVVETGLRVGRGDMIGTVGSTGLSRGPHLHFEIWRGGQPVDPALFLGDLLHLPHSAE